MSYVGDKHYNQKAKPQIANDEWVRQWPATNCQLSITTGHTQSYAGLRSVVTRRASDVYFAAPFFFLLLGRPRRVLASMMSCDCFLSPCRVTTSSSSPLASSSASKHQLTVIDRLHHSLTLLYSTTLTSTEQFHSFIHIRLKNFDKTQSNNDKV